MDHRASWEFEVAAPAEACVAAFAQAITSTKGLLASKWRVSSTRSGAIATYQGRGGLMGALTPMSEWASAEQGSAAGSRVVFDVVSSSNGRSVCHMHLGERGTQLVFTSDARFIRPAMQNVETMLRALDPHLVVRKG